MKTLILFIVLLSSFCLSAYAQAVRPQPETDLVYISVGPIMAMDSDPLNPIEPGEPTYSTAKKSWQIADTAQSSRVRRPLQVQSMVKNMPFPYAVGIAMDTATYGAIKAKIQSGDVLQLASRHAVDSLKKEIKATQQVATDQKALADYHAGQNGQLRQDNAGLQTELDTVKADLKTASEAVMDLYVKLPAHIQRPITPVEPKTITSATSAYIKVLRARKWKWAGWSFAGGNLLAGILIALAR